jgi:hypothetical protein
MLKEMKTKKKKKKKKKNEKIVEKGRKKERNNGFIDIRKVLSMNKEEVQEV